VIDQQSLSSLHELMQKLRNGFSRHDSFSIPLGQHDKEILEALIQRLENTDPYFSPEYMGHMSSYVHPLSSSAYWLAMQLNSNNHSYDGGRATTELEHECISELGHLFGWPTAQGHLCSGGTIGNFEALWSAREQGCNVVIASRSAHYCHRRAADILGMTYLEARVDAKHRIDLEHVGKMLAGSGSAVVVATCGTTAVGAVDGIAQLTGLTRSHSALLHVDAAYGGYYRLVAEYLDEHVGNDLQAITHADSVVVDPHKHGMQGFGCGAVLFRDARQKVYAHDAPYTYDDKTKDHLGLISLECSRPGAAAAALWATLQAFPLTAEGRFSERLRTCHDQATSLYVALLDHPRYRPLLKPDTDIVCLVPRALGDRVDQSIMIQRDVARLKDAGIHVATMQFESHDGSVFQGIRCVMMKPEHGRTAQRLLEILGSLGSAA
jgi:glutamate/tyrosine decarboxylase-like PLP-dependent enzyme